MSRALILPIFVWCLAQVIKALRQGGRLSPRAFLVSGGMPSAHAALVAALATQVAFLEGVDSTLFAVSAVLAGVVAYDAAGVRRASGEQAKLLNRLVDRVARGRRSDFERLREELGHQPAEVAAGLLLGVGVTVVINLWFW
jgi:uncharacterized protein